MTKGKKIQVGGLIVGLMSLVASPVFARSISMKDAGTALWIFIIIGGIIVLLQLIPAAILFFSFIGTSSSILFNRKKAMEEMTAEEKEKLVVAGYEAAPSKK